MARKTYPETAQEEADRINKASGDPTGISAQQVANNRALNENLTAAFGFGGSGKPSSGPGSNPVAPFSQLTAAISESFEIAANEGQTKLEETVSDLTAGAKSGLNQLAGDAKNFGNSALGGNVTLNSAVSGAVDKLRSVAGSTSNIAADISGTLNKLTGGNLAGGLLKAAGSISGAAGMLNNILSLKRAANLPKGAETFIKQGSAIQLQASSKNDWRVRITCQWDVFNSPLFKRLQDTGGVVWPYMPNITVSTKADYSALTTVHSNYTNYAYKGSQVDDITISGDFTCQTENDAAYWIAATTFFKTATKMFFGQGNLAGNPPLICNLTGYGSSIFDKVPIIIKSFSVDLKDDVNYVKCDTYGTNTWVPVISTISVVVSPVYNRERMRKFNLQDYARGKIADANGVGYI
jgi:hypothetical protein